MPAADLPRELPGPRDGLSLGLTEGAEAARYQLASYLMAWRATRAALAATEAEQARVAAETGHADLLQSIPGIGPVIAALLLGELGDLTRFDDPRQALQLAGLNLTHQSSGQHRAQTHISKRGRPGARYELYQAAQVVVATNPAWRAWYDHLRQRAQNPLAPKAALVAIAAIWSKWVTVHAARRRLPSGPVTGFPASTVYSSA